MKNYKGRRKNFKTKNMSVCLLTVILWSDLTMTRAKIICRVTKMSNRDLTSRI